MWEFGGSLFLMTVDNIEAHDVDIFDISNPASPQPVGEHDLTDLQGFDIIDQGNIGAFPATNHHDSVVKIINGRPIALTAYWDGGYVTYDVSNPATPQYIGDTTFEGADPLTGITPPEGNAHQAEFSHDNRFFVAADEDFDTHRPGTFTVDGKEYDAVGLGLPRPRCRTAR
jgi:hypothetical protein